MAGPIFVSFPAPPREFDSSFYNAGRAENGGEQLKGFVDSLKGVFRYTTQADHDKVKQQTNKLFEGFDFDAYVGTTTVGDLADFVSGGNADSEGFLDLVAAAKNVNTVQDNITGKVGANLDKAKAYFHDLGVFDSQVALNLLKEWSKVSGGVDANKNNVKNSSNGFIDGQDDENKLTNLCGKLGMQVVKDNSGVIDKKATRKALKEEIDKVVDKFSSFKLKDEAFSEIQRDIAISSVKPVIGLMGANMIGAVQNAKVADEVQRQEKREKQLEVERKIDENKGAARKHAQAKAAERNAEATAKSNKAQRREKA